MLQKVPRSNNNPLFQIFSGGRSAPLTDSMARKHLKKVSHLLNIHPLFYLMMIFMILGGQVPLGVSTMGFHWNI